MGFVRYFDCFLAVGRLQQVVPMHPQPRHQNIAIGFAVVDDENTRRTMHG